MRKGTRFLLKKREKAQFRDDASFLVLANYPGTFRGRHAAQMVCRSAVRGVKWHNGATDRAETGDDRALFPRPYFALYHFQSGGGNGGGGGGGGGESDGSKTNFTLMEKLFNIPRLREREGGRERGREGTGCSSSRRMEARDQGCQLPGWKAASGLQMSLLACSLNLNNVDMV